MNSAPIFGPLLHNGGVAKSTGVPARDAIAARLGAFIQKRRIEMGFSSQEALAKQLQLVGAPYSRGGLASLEAGDVELPGRVVFRGLCTVLEISPARFLQVAGYLDEPEADELAHRDELRSALRRAEEGMREMGQILRQQEPDPK